MLALPGGAYVYQGEELGLWEVEDLPEEVLEDPIWERSGHTRRGRDGARVPLPWTEDGGSYGFGPSTARDPGCRNPPPGPPWQPSAGGRPASMLELYRAALRIRREHPGLGAGPMHWQEAPEGVLSCRARVDFLCVVNVEGASVELPAYREVLLASGPLEGSRLPPNVAVWLQT